METLPTDKNYCIVLKGGVKTYLNEAEYKFFQNELINGKELIVIRNKFFMRSMVAYGLPAVDVEKEERERKGEWKCEYGHWHKKGEDCGHGLQKRYEH